MSVSKVYQLFKTLERDSIILYFKGLVTPDLMKSVFQIMEQKLMDLEEDTRLKKKVFNVMVECLQNLFHHGKMQDQALDSLNFSDLYSSMFVIARVEHSFYIRTGNYISNTESDLLMERLDKINSLGKEELRMYYQEILNNGGRSVKGTAGLGIIDIARKSGNKLEYEFVQVTEKLRFFCLNVKVD